MSAEPAPMGTATGTFEIRMVPHAPAEASSPAISRRHFDKTWTGDLSGHSQGEFLSVGDPASGAAAYVVMEVFAGTLHGREGQFAFHQYGTLLGGEQTLQYEIVPGSGSGALASLSGTLRLELVERAHHYTLTFQERTP
ncbi:DUF3224 domain-containing protein [Deinococcus hohokamensis]|uniref:DUF3224 domain-containing protein n=1 Tax=Deinococcus hohokamensis TaxID=309883 RepID=A0ABV9IDL2_9DEIO